MVAKDNNIFCVLLLCSLSIVVSGYIWISFHNLETFVEGMVWTRRILWLIVCVSNHVQGIAIDSVLQQLTSGMTYRRRFCWDWGIRSLWHTKRTKSHEKWTSQGGWIESGFPSPSSIIVVGGWLWVQVMLPEELQRALLQLQGLGSRTYGVLAFKFQVDNSCEGWLLDLNRFDELNLHQSLPDCSFIIVQSP